MKALQLLAHGKPGTFEVREVSDLQAGPDEVVVKVRACGLNHLDLWTEAGELPVPIKLPLTPGCEISGEVLRIGEGSLYPALHRLDERGWVEGRWELSETRRRTKVYRLTTVGRAQLRAESGSWRQFVDAVGKVLDAREQPV